MGRIFLQPVQMQSMNPVFSGTIKPAKIYRVVLSPHGRNCDAAEVNYTKQPGVSEERNCYHSEISRGSRRKREWKGRKEAIGSFLSLQHSTPQLQPLSCLHFSRSLWSLEGSFPWDLQSWHTTRRAREEEGEQRGRRNNRQSDRWCRVIPKWVRKKWDHLELLERGAEGMEGESDAFPLMLSAFILRKMQLQFKLNLKIAKSSDKGSAGGG